MPRKPRKTRASSPFSISETDAKFRGVGLHCPRCKDARRRWTCIVSVDPVVCLIWGLAERHVATGTVLYCQACKFIACTECLTAIGTSILEKERAKGSASSKPPTGGNGKDRN